jgi:imidazolonepropionase-like amidohydrolase
MKIRVVKALICLVVLLSAYGCSEQRVQEKISIPPGSLVITNGTIIDGTGASPIQDGIIVIQDDQIKFIGQNQEFSIPPEAEVVDALGGTIMPGIIDAHVHSTSDPAVRRDFLTAGVTAVCDLGSPLVDMRQFEQETFGQDLVARGLKAGPILTAPGGLPDAVLHANLNYEVASPDEAREAVEKLLDWGADFLKVYLHQENEGFVYPMLREDELSAIVEEAHERETLVRTHVTYISLLDMAISTGVDVIDHIPIHAPQSGPDRLDEAKLIGLLESEDPVQVFFEDLFPRYEAQLEKMADAGIVMVPTLDRPFGKLFQAPNPSQEEKITLDIILAIVQRFYDFGGIVGLGTDFNIGTNMNAGMPIGEMEMLHAAGLTRLEVIEAATRHSAYACGHEDQLGTIEPGKVADVITVDGDPLEDLQVMSRVILVIKGGKIAHSDR